MIWVKGRSLRLASGDGAGEPRRMSADERMAREETMAMQPPLKVFWQPG